MVGEWVQLFKQLVTPAWATFGSSAYTLGTSPLGKERYVRFHRTSLRTHSEGDVVDDRHIGEAHYTCTRANRSCTESLYGTSI